MMQINFESLVTRAMQVPGRKHMRPVIEKELLHYDILFALDRAGLLEHLTFQGGTCLRLCHSAPRFSEDLDFVGGRNFESGQLMAMKSCIEHYIGRRYGLKVTVKAPDEMRHSPEYREIKVDKWQIRIQTAERRKDLPQQMIKIEVANLPAYQREPQSLQHNYDFLPDGYDHTLVMAESLEEIMADKLVSLANCQRYIRHRDIWDLRWLQQKQATLNPELVAKKIEDYQIIDYPKRLSHLLERLPEIIQSDAFSAQMRRFIPADVQERTLNKSAFYDFLCREIQQLYQSLQQQLYGSPKSEVSNEFTM